MLGESCATPCGAMRRVASCDRGQSYERWIANHLSAGARAGIFPPRVSRVLRMDGRRGRHPHRRARPGRTRPGNQAAAAGRLVPFPGMHLLQRVVPAIVAPDRGRHPAGQDLAGLHRDAAGRRGPSGRGRSARHDEEAQGRVPDAGRGGGAHGRRRHLLLHRRTHGAGHRHRGGRRRQGDRHLGQLRLERLHPGRAVPIRPAPRRSTRSSPASRSSTCRAARRSAK